MKRKAAAPWIPAHELKRALVLAFFVARRPRGKASVRFAGHGYQDRPTELFENCVATTAAAAMEKAAGSPVWDPGAIVSRPVIFPLDEPLALSLVFGLARPKAPKFPSAPASKPDLDNLEKAVKDGLTLARVWVDDARVVESAKAKRFSEIEGVWIRVERFLA